MEITAPLLVLVIDQLIYFPHSIFFAIPVEVEGRKSSKRRLRGRSVASHGCPFQIAVSRSAGSVYVGPFQQLVFISAVSVCGSPFQPFAQVIGVLESVSDTPEDTKMRHVHPQTDIKVPVNVSINKHMLLQLQK